jgi:predicted ATPase/DNA-binding SARP family transcriptional activator
VLNAPTSLNLYLFGSFRLERDGQPLRLPTRKTESLLAYLALHPDPPQSREYLAALYWGDSTDEQARRSLRVALTSLRKLLGDSVFETGRDTLQLNPHAPLWVDAYEFTRLTRPSPHTDTAALESAVTLYQGDLLAEFYDEWMDQEREQTRQRYLALLLRLIQHYRSQSEYEAAIRCAQKLLTADPASEQAHQHLMFCYVGLGNRSAALKQFERCRQSLRDQLGVEPSRETVALYHWIARTAQEPSLHAARLTNLPIPLTSFIGRKQETATVKQQLTAGSRLVTLLGPGGSGKTRLAVQAATDLVDTFTDGVWWVELAALGNDSLLPQTIAEAIGVAEQPNRSYLETLTDELHGRQLLLVLDNCEHLLAACATLATTLLSQCPALQILATSRAALSVTGELTYTVPPLPLPDPNSPTESTIAENESVRLFVERARAIQPDFTLSAATTPHVTQICRRLDGIPLAIELAAARLKELSAAQIAQRLDERFTLLVSDNQAVLPRQQTLRALLDWSYDLLSPPEQALLRRLATFAGGWTLEAAVNVAGGYDELPTQEPVANHASLTPLTVSPLVIIRDLLTHLKEKSLLWSRPDDDKIRYGMLETIREYARERLAEADEETIINGRHLNYFLASAEATYPHLRGPEQQTTLDRLDGEHDNLRAALQRTQDEAGLRLAAALGRFWELRGYFQEGRDWLTRLLPTATPSPARARALEAASLLALFQGDTTTAETLVQEHLALCHQLADEEGIATALSHLGFIGWRRGDYLLAHQSLEKSLTLARQRHDHYRVAFALHYLGNVILNEGRVATARALQEESLALRRALGDKREIAESLNNLGILAGQQKEYATAQALHEESLALQREMGDRRGVAWSLNYLGVNAVRQKQYNRSRALHLESLALRRELGDRQGMAATLNNLGEVASRSGDYPAAQGYHQQSLALRREMGDRVGIALSLNNLGVLACRQEQYATAWPLYQESLTLARDIGDNSTVVLALHNLGMLALELGQPAAARPLSQEALALWWATNNKAESVSILAQLALAAARLAEIEQAVQLAAAAETMRASLKLTHEPMEQRYYNETLATIQTALGEAAMTTAWQHASAVPPEQIIESILAGTL